MQDEIADLGSGPAPSPANSDSEQLKLFRLPFPMNSEYLGLNYL